MNRFLTLLLLIAPALVFAQTTRRITGQVLDRATGEPLVGATVFIADLGPSCGRQLPRL